MNMAQYDHYSGGADAYTREYFDQYQSTISNGEARILICFCVDTSSSMSIVTNPRSELREIRGTNRDSDGNSVVSVEPRFPWVKLVNRLDELQKVFDTMLTKMKANPVISHSAAVSIVTFDLFADCCMEFTDIRSVNVSRLPKLKLGKDRTNAARGLRMALNRLDHQRRLNESAGNESYRPVLVFMSDGNPTDAREAEEVRQLIRERSEAGELNVIPVCIGDQVDERWIRSLSKDSVVYHMQTNAEFEEVFSIITKKFIHATMVISTDQDGDNLAFHADEDVSNTLYGVQASAGNSDLGNLAAFMNA